MKRFIVLAVCCLLFAGLAHAQKKSSRKSSPSGGVRAPKPLPAPVQSDLGITQTPEMIEQLRQLNQPPTFTAPPPTEFVPTPNWPPTPVAEVASSSTFAKKCLEQITDPAVRCVTGNEVYVRSDPGSFFVNTLNKGEYFRVRAQRAGYFYGDVLGGLNQHNVWVASDELDDLERHPKPRQAVEGEYNKSGSKRPKSGITTRAHLKKRFGKLLPETPDGQNGTWLVEPPFIQRFDPDPRLNQIEIFGKRDPGTGELSDLQRVIDFSDTRAIVKARYITKDGKAVAVDVTLPGQANGNGLWGFMDRNRARFVTPPPKK